MIQNNNGENRPIPLVRPPKLYGGILVLGIVINFIFPLRIFFGIRLSLRLLIAALLVGASVALVTWAAKTLSKANVDPRFKPVGQIVAAGPFGFSRNPIYLGFTLFYLGVSMAFNSLWLILFLPVVLVIMIYGVIKREEKYLEQRFGEEYRNYKTKVRRWI